MAETENLEYKESTADKSSILKSVTAFANSSGGAILIGMNDKGEAIGITVGRHTIENLGRAITEEIRPAVYPSIQTKKINGRQIIEIKVDSSASKPHFYGGVAYLRIGKINKAIEPHALEEFLRKKFMGGYDELPAAASLEEIEEKKIAEFIGLMRYAGRKKVTYRDKKHTLKALGIYQNENLFNAAVMAFGTDPYSFFPQLAFRCVYRRGGEIRDYLFATGTIFEIEHDVELFLERNLQRSVRIEGYERKEYLEIPTTALREAIFNSLIHRDYFHPSGNYLEISEEEVVIKNPGMLPESLRIKDLYGKHDSIPRNKLLASLAYLAGKIEQWGEGTLKIIEAVASAGLKQPVFREESGFFYIIFKRSIIDSADEKVLSLFKRKRKVSSGDVSGLLSVSERKARNIIARLVASGFIRKHGKTKGVYYSV